MLALTLCTTASVHSSTLSWTGAAGDSNVSTAGNWSLAQAPASGDSLIFTGTNSLAPKLSTALTVSSLSFATNASAFSLTGTGTYTINTSSGITNNSVNLQTVASALALGANQTWNAAAGDLAFYGAVNLGSRTLTLTGSNNITISGNISGTGAMTKTGTGKLTLSGSNAYSGTTTLSAGTIVIGSNNAVGTGTFSLGTANVDVSGARALANAVTLAGDTTFLGSDNLTMSGAVSITGNRTLTVSGTGKLTFSGVVDTTKNSYTWTKSGSGTLALLAANTFTKLKLSSGTLITGNDSALGSSTFSLGTATLQGNGNGTRTFANSVTLVGNPTFGGTDDLIFTASASLTGSRTFTINNSNVTFSGAITGTGYALTKNGPGNLILSGNSANTYTGATTVNDGKLVLAKTAGVNAFGGSLAIGDGSGYAASTIVQLNASNQIADTTAVTVNADGQLNLQTYAEAIGALTMTGGSIIGTNRLDLGGNVTVSAAGTNSAAISTNLGLNGARTFTINDNGSTTDVDLTIAGVISDGSVTSALNKVGSGFVALNGTNTYTGGTTLSAGGISAGTNSAFGTGTISLGAATIQSSSGARSFSNALTLAGDTIFSGTDNLAFSGSAALTGNRTLTINNTTTTFSGAIAQDIAGRTLTKTGVGTLALTGTGANTITGTTTVNAGTLLLGKNSGAAIGGDLVIGDGSGTDTVQFSTANQLASAANVTVNGSGVLDLNGNNQAIASLTLGGGALITTGTGALTLGGDVSHNGSGAQTATISGKIDLGGTTRTFTVNDSSAATDLTISAVISNGALTKTGGGTMLLSASNSYTGTTTINGGTLQLGATSAIASASSVILNNSATFDLNGFNATLASLSGTGNVALSGGTLTFGNGNSTTFGGPIFGNGSIIKNGSGTFTLSGSASFTGATNVNSGTLQFSGTNIAPSSSATTIASGASLDLNSFNEVLGSLSGSGNVTLGSGYLTVGGNNSSTTFSGIISGSGGLIKTGTGAMTVTNANTFDGLVTINDGSLTLSGSNAKLASASAFYIGNRTTLTLDNSTGTNTNRIADTAAIWFNGGTFAFVSGSNGSTETVGALNAIGGASTVSIANGGTSSALTFNSLGTIASGATVNFSASGGTLGSGVGGPHIYVIGQASGFMGGWATVGSNFAEYYADGVRAFSNYYTGSDGINVNDGTKVVLLSGSSPGTATTLTNAGTTSNLSLSISDVSSIDLGTATTRTLNLVSGGLIKSSATATTISGQGRLTAGGTATGSLAISIDAGHTLSIASSIIDNAGANGTYGDADDGVVSLAKTDAGLLVLTGSNAFSGNVFVNGGTLRISAENNLGANGNDVIFNSGTLNVASGFTASSGKIFTISSDLTGTIDVDAGQTLTLANAANVLTSGNAASVLYKNGGGIFVLQNADTSFTGTLQVNAGVAELRNAQSLGGAILLNSGTLRLRNDADTNFGNTVSLSADSTIEVTRLTGTSGAVNLTLAKLSAGANTLTITGSNGASLAFGSVNLTANTTFNTSTATVSLSSIGGGFGFTKTGTNTLTLSGTSSYTGATTISAGTLRIAGTNATSPLSAVALASGAIFDLNNYSTKIAVLSGSGSIALGSAVLTAGDVSSSTFAGALNGAGGFIKSGAGILTLGGTSGYSGATTISAGTLQLGTNNAIASASNISIANGATFDLNNFNQTTTVLTGSGNVTLGSGTLTLGTSSGSSTFSGVLSGSGSVVKNGTSTLVLNSGNTLSGAITINAGILDVENLSALGGTTGGTVVNSSAELQIGTSVSGEALTLSGSGSSAGALHNVSGTVTWGGPVSLAANSTVASDAGTLTLSGSVSTGANVLTTTGSGNIIISGAISGSAGLAKSGTGTLTLSGSNSFGGTVNVTAGVLSVQHSAALGASGAGNGTTIGSGAAVQISNASGINIAGEILTLSGAGIANTGALSNTSGNNSWSGNVVLAADSTIGVAQSQDALTISGVISESGTASALTKAGTGTLVFSAANTYSGATNIVAGTLQLAASDRINDASAVTISSGALLDLNDYNETIGSLAGAGDVDTGSATGGTLTVGVNDRSTTFSGNISGIGDVVKTGTGTLTLTGTNSTYSGDTYVNSGKLAIDNDARLGADGGLIFSGGTLLASGSFTSSRVVAVNADSAIDTNGNTVILSGSLSGTANLAKNGAGTLKLSGSNAGFTGSFAVNGGKLAVNAAFTNSTVTLASGAELDGSGSVNDVAAASGSTVAPGNSGAGQLGTGNFNLGSGAHLSIEIGGTTAGTGYDEISVTGSVTISGALDASFVNGYTPTHVASLSVPYVIGGANTTLDKFFIIINDGADAVNGTFSNQVMSNTIFGTLPTITFGNQPFAISYTGDAATNSTIGGNDIVLTAIPEPNELTFFAGGIALQIAWFRLRKRR